MMNTCNKIAEVFNWLLVLVFSYSAATKIFNFSQFKTDVITSPLIPESIMGFVSFGVPALEVIILALLLSKYKLFAYYLSFIALVMFTTYFIIFYKIANTDCGCGKLFAGMEFTPHLLFNLMLIGINLYLIMSAPKRAIGNTAPGPGT